MIDWIARFPSTNGLVLTGILQALVTTIAVVCGWNPPDGWFLFVAGFAGVGAAQFTSKRITHRHGNGNGSG